MNRRRAFSLVEVTLALGIIAFALLAVVGLIPTALQASREAVDLTRTSMIAQDAAVRLPGLSYTDATAATTVTWWYDSGGKWLAIDLTAAHPYASVFYRVDVARGTPAVYPAGTDPATRDPSNNYSTRLLAATATITWPADPNTGIVAAGTNTNKRAVYPLLTRAMP